MKVEEKNGTIYIDGLDIITIVKELSKENDRLIAVEKAHQNQVGQLLEENMKLQQELYRGTNE